MNFTWEEVKNVQPGDVFTLRGQRYKLNKKTSTAISVTRWYWFNVVLDWLGRKLVRNNEGNNC